MHVCIIDSKCVRSNEESDRTECPSFLAFLKSTRKGILLATNKSSRSKLQALNVPVNQLKHVLYSTVDAEHVTT